MLKSDANGPGKTPYVERDDLAKLQAQWNKLSGLRLRREPSAAIVRCSTAAEIAANYAIRHVWAQRTDFSAPLMDDFLVWANGLHGKINRLFLPVQFVDPDRDPVARELRTLASQINKVRNGVVHQGNFAEEEHAEDAIRKAKRFVDLIIGLSIPGFAIRDGKERGSASG